MRPGTHPGPTGHPSSEGMQVFASGLFSLPSWEGCRVSGGVGFVTPDLI